MKIIGRISAIMSEFFLLVKIAHNYYFSINITIIRRDE